MSFLRKLARRKAPPSLPGPSSLENATDLATSDDIAPYAPLAELLSTERQPLTAQSAYHAPERSGHRYDRVQVGGESRNHLGDVYHRHVTYNIGAPLAPSKFTEKQREEEYDGRREAARLEAEKRLEDSTRISCESQRLDFLRALEFDTMDSRLATIGPAHTETCTWILEATEYSRWQSESCRPENHGVLWIKGKPGSGKSTLMKYALQIAQERDDGDVIASFLFNARGQSLDKCAEGMYRSLLHQVLTQLPHLCPNRTHVKQQSWSVEMLESILRTCVLTLKPGEHVILYIDALDECVHTEIRDMVGYLEDLVDLAVSRGLRFSICLSSRHYPHITMHKFEELMLDDRNEHLEDISKYVHTHAGRLNIPSPTKSNIEADINRRSLGIFLWAVLVIKILREKHDDGAPVSELLISLATVPDKLGSLFANIIANSDKGMITALQWTLHAQSLLSPQELYFAIKTSTNQISTGQWNEDDADKESIKRFITRSSRGLVEPVQEMRLDGRWIVQFIHESVREHLLQGNSTNLGMCDPQLNRGFADAAIARHCLSYLQLDSPKYLQCFDWRLPPSWYSSERFPLHEFAANHLLYHADLAYKAGALSLTFISELPVRLLICSQNLSNPFLLRSYDISESVTILYLLLMSRCHALAEALLARCSKTANPGIVTFRMTAEQTITFDVNASCSEGYGGVLGAAAAHGPIPVVQQLLHLGAEVVPSRRDVCSPLIPAVTWGYKEGVELLLQQGADVNAVVYPVVPESALIIAGRQNNHDIASLLLAYGADPNYRNEYGTALDYALNKRRTKMAQLLWEAQFPASEWDRTLLACKSRTAEHWADTATVHRIAYHSESELDGNYHPDGENRDSSDDNDSGSNGEIRNIYRSRRPSVSSHSSCESIIYATTI